MFTIMCNESRFEGEDLLEVVGKVLNEELPEKEVLIYQDHECIYSNDGGD